MYKEQEMSDDKIKAHVYIDGNFTVHIHKYLAKTQKKTINWPRLIEYIKERITKEEQRTCVVESHFFVGTGTLTTDTERDFLFNSMEHAGITKHATPLKEKVSGGGLKEDAVDTNLVFFATQDFYKREKYEYLVLLAGDSDFVPLMRGLAAEAVKTFVIYMDFEDKELGTTRTAQTLLENADVRESIETLLRERVDERIRGIFAEHSPQGAGLPAQKGRGTTKAKSAPQGASPSRDDAASPFTRKQLEAAIRQEQAKVCDGRNEYVLLSSVGTILNEVTKKNMHGKLRSLISRHYGSDFDIDGSSRDVPRIRLK